MSSAAVAPIPAQRAVPGDEAAELSGQPAGSRGQGAQAEQSASDGAGRTQTGVRKLRSHAADAVKEPTAKRARLQAPAALPKPAVNGLHARSRTAGALGAAQGTGQANGAGPAQRQGAAPQPGTAMARMLSRASAAAVSAPAQHASPAAGGGSNALPAAGTGAAVPKGRGAGQSRGMHGSSMAGRIGTPQPGGAESDELEEQEEEALKAVRAMPRSGGGLFGAAMAGMDGRSSKLRSGATRLR